MSEELVKQENIEDLILNIRGQKVMLDKDLAQLYGVSTKALKRATKRNIGRFPSDFMFQLTKADMKRSRCQIGTLNIKAEMDTKRSGGLRSQIVTLKRGQNIKYFPYVFTEQGVAMLSSVLHSKRAINVNIQIMRTFTKLRKLLASHEDLRRKLEELEKKYDGQFKVVFDAINELMEIPDRTVKNIGFLK